MKSALAKKHTVMPAETLIHVIRGRKVMLDEELASLYGVETKAFNQAVRRNIERFPDDFMFQLTMEEAALMRSQFVTTSKRNIRYQGFAFTELGIAMLSSVLRSPRAIQVNITIMRAFVRLRELMISNKDIAARIEKLEHNHKQTDSIIEVLIDDIEKLSNDVHWIKNPPLPRKYPIGFVGKGMKKS